jgi:hypothetical protein
MNHPYREWLPAAPCKSCEQRERQETSRRRLWPVAGVAFVAVQTAWTGLAWTSLDITDRLVAEMAHFAALADRSRPAPPPPASPPPPACVPSPQPRIPETDLPGVGVGILPLGHAHYAVDRTTLRAFLEEEDMLMRQARLKVEQDNGKVVGLRIVHVPPGSTLARLGFESGDRLDTICAIPLTTPEQALAAYERLSNSVEISVVVTRGKSRVTLRYTIV